MEANRLQSPVLAKPEAKRRPSNDKKASKNTKRRSGREKPISTNGRTTAITSSLLIIPLAVGMYNCSGVLVRGYGVRGTGAAVCMVTLPRPGEQGPINSNSVSPGSPSELIGVGIFPVMYLAVQARISKVPGSLHTTNSERDFRLNGIQRR